MIPSPFHSARGPRPVRLVIVHTAEGARTVESLGAWFQRADAKASSHTGIDDARVEQYVPFDRTAWTTRTANPISDSVELCGFAKWTRDEWLGQHGHMLELCAAWIRDRCAARGIPIRKLTPAQVATGEAGVCGHVDWTVGMKDGTHTDPGLGFPWDHVIGLANGGGAAPGPSGPYCTYGERSDHVMALQKFMTSHFPSYNRYRPTGFYGLATKSGIEEFQKRTGITGPDADGFIVGPRTLAKLQSFGFAP